MSDSQETARNNSVKRNFTYQMIYELLTFILPFISSPYLSRIIGAEGLGIFGYSDSIAQYFILFSMLGLKNYGNRTIAQSCHDKNALEKNFSNILTLHVLVSLVVTAAYIVYSFFIASTDDKLYAFLQLPFVISALLDISWLYFGLEQFKTTVIISSVVKLVSFAGIFVFIKSSDDLWKYVLLISMGHFMSQALLWIPLHRHIKFCRPELSLMKTHIKPLLVLFIPSIAVSIYKVMDKIMLGSMSTKAELGFYDNAEKIIKVPTMIITAFGNVMLPRMSGLIITKDNKTSERYMSLSMEFMMCLSFAMTGGIIAVAEEFSVLFWGNDFLRSGELMFYLAVTVPFLAFANIIRTQYLIPTHNDRIYVVSVILGAIINLIINATLIPHFAATGVAIGTIAAEIMVCLYQAISVRKMIPVKKYFARTIVFALPAVIMVMGMSFVRSILNGGVISLLIQIVVGVIIYGGFTLIYERLTGVFNSGS